MTLTATIGEIQAFTMLNRPGGSLVTPQERAFAARSDIAPLDVASFVRGSRAFRLLLIMRCPKRGSIGFQGVLQPKRMDHAKRAGSSDPVKSGAHGVGVHPDSGEIFVSDYDLMSVWSATLSGGYAKVDTGMAPVGQNPVVDRLNAIFFANRPRRPGRPPQGFQHGGQDDLKPSKGQPHPNLGVSERCAAFRQGEMALLEGIDAVRAYYHRHALHPFPYDHSGRFTG